MAGAFHGTGEPDCVINVGVSGPGVVRSAISKMPDANMTELAEVIKKTAFKITRMGQLVGIEASKMLGVPFGMWTCPCADTCCGRQRCSYSEEIGLESRGLMAQQRPRHVKRCC